MVDTNRWVSPGPSWNEATTRLNAVIGWYSKHKNYFRDPKSKLAVYWVYNPGLVGTKEKWRSLLTHYRLNSSERDAGNFSSPLSLPQEPLPEWTGQGFDGYFWTGHAVRDSDLVSNVDLMSRIWRNGTGSGEFYIGGVIAGFDFSSVCSTAKPIVIDRENGAVFDRQVAGVIRAGVDHVYVPYNDWGKVAVSSPLPILLRKEWLDINLVGDDCRKLIRLMLLFLRHII